MKLYLDDFDKTYSSFTRATKFLQNEFGYEGEAWEYVLKTKNLQELYEFLCDDSVNCDIM